MKAGEYSHLLPRERRQRRNPLDKEEKALEYDVYGKFEFERLGTGNKSKPEWGRRWCPVVECAEVAGWEADLAGFEEELTEMREEAEETY